MSKRVNRRKKPVCRPQTLVKCIVGIKGVLTELGPCPLSRFVHRPSFQTPSDFGQSQPSVRREGPNRVRWPVSKKPVSTKPIFLKLTYMKKNGLVDTGLHTLN